MNFMAWWWITNRRDPLFGVTSQRHLVLSTYIRNLYYISTQELQLYDPTITLKSAAPTQNLTPNSSPIINYPFPLLHYFFPHHYESNDTAFTRNRPPPASITIFLHHGNARTTPSMPFTLPATSPLYEFSSNYRACVLYNVRITALARGQGPPSIPLSLLGVRSFGPQSAADEVFDNIALLIFIDAFIPRPDTPVITHRPPTNALPQRPLLHRIRRQAQRLRHTTARLLTRLLRQHLQHRHRRRDLLTTIFHHEHSPRRRSRSH